MREPVNMSSQENPSRVSRWLQRQGPTVFSVWTISAAFCTYFCMYAFRKPFTAGTFADSSLAGVDYKTVLVIAQVLGYTLSKFIGIKVISEISASRRAVTIVGLIATAELALILFAIVPPPWNFVMLFLNGLPLGMVFGLIMAYLEGRRLTEALAAGLCASFVVSSGVVKSVGRALILNYGVDEYWMPALTGLIFAGPLFLSVWMLTKIPPPDAVDIEQRTERVPLTRDERWSFFFRFAIGLSLLLSVYVALTLLRSIRDDFAVEIWIDLGESGRPAIFAETETIVMFAVVALNAAAFLIRRNRAAFLSTLVIIAGGFSIVVASIFLQRSGVIGPFAFMVLSGIGLYVPYVAFHTTVFERLIAATREKANLGFLLYLADSTGYLGYVAVMLFRTFGTDRKNMLDFFQNVSLTVATASLLAVAIAGVYFVRRLPTETSAGRAVSDD